jgi:DNA-binding GntR family transcriptional regulator
MPDRYVQEDSAVASEETSSQLQRSAYGIYGLIAGSNDLRGDRASQIACLVEDDLMRHGWPVGDVIGPEKRLAQECQVGHAVIRQALRLLEIRGVGTVRRGPSGGLIVARPSRAQLIARLTHHLRWIGVTRADAKLARLFVISLARPAHTAAVPHERSPLALLNDTLLHFDKQVDSPVRLSIDVGDKPKRRRHPEAIGIIEILSREITQERCIEGYCLGSLSSLSARLAVGAPIMKQAVRLMSEWGVLERRHGRSGGLYLKVPTMGSIVRFVHGQFLAAQLNVEESHWLVWQINRIHAAQAASKRVITADMREAFDSLESADDDTFHYRWVSLQGSIANIAQLPVLHMFVRCFAAYNIRVRGPQGPTQPRDRVATLAATRLVMRGIEQGDVALATDAQERCHALIDRTPIMNRYDSNHQRRGAAWG